MAEDGGGVQDVGDERGGTAEGFGYDGSVFDQDVVAVVSGDENLAVGNWMQRWSRGSWRW
ncbi:BnaCnng52880D [Brassica napus]|uniref:BnaCnng52880D protein n=1 Tax=Brassica napus TaxID=3708 RepID=A0A078JJM4_BRANA|nr:BnaCnng52880D [Brassica napus]